MFKDFSEFEKTKRSLDFLNDLALEVDLNSVTLAVTSQPAAQQRLNIENFNTIWDASEVCRRTSRVVASGLYLVALSGTGWIVLSNVYFVLRYVMT